MKKETSLAVVDEQALAELKELYPTETSNFNRIMLPRLGFVAQDQTEGKGKTMKVVTEAGTFFEERQTEELDENGKKVWKKKEIGLTVEGIILYHRYQLSYYDEATEEYSSTPVYDSKDDILPLFCNKKQIAKGTPDELKAMYKFTDKDGKEKSKLKDNRILYVLIDNELFQLNLHGSSMYSFLKYARTVNPPAVITKFGSEPQEKGQINWNMMTFKPVRNINAEELVDIREKIKEIKITIQLEKGVQTNADSEFEKM